VNYVPHDQKEVQAEVATSSTQPTAGDEWRKGWKIVASAFVGNGMGFNMFFMSAGLFVIPLQKELGLPRTAVMVGTVAMLMVAFLSPLAAPYIDRYGPRRGAIVGYAMLIVAYALLTVLPPGIVTYYSITAIFVVAGTITSSMTFCKSVSLIFHKSAGLAFGITMSGVSLVSALVIPLLSAVIVSHGWRAGYGVSAALVALIGLPILIVTFKPNSALPSPPSPDHSPKSQRVASDVLRSSRFWLLSAALACGTFCLGGMIGHLYPMFVEAGLGTSVAATLLSLYAISIGAGRIIIGLMLDRFDPARVAAICMLFTAIGAAILFFVLVSALPPAAAFLAALLLGWGHGAEADFPAFFTLRLFDRDGFAKVYSLINIFTGGFSALGGLFFAAVFDWTGDYLPVVILTVILWLCGAGLSLRLGKSMRGPSPLSLTN